jgi:DNA-directed RNA polymerase subunit RPC12/RpoP
MMQTTYPLEGGGVLSYLNYVNLVCSTEDCRGELEEVLSAFAELLSDIRGFKLPDVDVDPNRVPLLVTGGVRRGLEEILKIVKDILGKREFNVDSISLHDVIEASLEEERFLASILFKRILYEAVRGRGFKMSWVNGRCPICGSLPILAVVRRERGDIFSRDVLYLRCICGFTESYEYFKCPSCGVSGRDAFEYNVVGEVVYRTCSRCGHAVGILRDGPSLDLDLAMLVVVYGLVGLASKGS